MHHAGELWVREAGQGPVALLERGRPVLLQFLCASRPCKCMRVRVHLAWVMRHTPVPATALQSLASTLLLKCILLINLHAKAASLPSLLC